MKKILMIFLLAITTGMLAFAQTVQIRGTVTSSEDGVGIPGVMISVKGTTVGTMTDADGKYTLNVPAGSTTLVFTYVGMQKVETDIAGRTVIDVVMAPDLQVMDEIVVVGYGTQKKSDVTGSISQVKGEAIAGLATPSFDAQLAGRSAGVQVSTTSGILGSTPRMNIRGVSSISSGTYPLVVVDGIPIFTGNTSAGGASANALGDINPADIESMEILKDGSATAIYGSRAANGVILITTKKGGKDQGKYKITYSMYAGVAQPVRLFDLLNADEFVTINNEKRSNYGQSAIASSTGAKPGTYDTDWQAAVLNSNAFQMDHTLALTGATDRTSYYFSIGYSDQEGVAKPNSMQRYSVRASVDQKVTKWLNMGVNLGYTKSEYYGLNQGSNALSGNIFSAIRQHPNVPIYDPDDPTGYNIDDVNTDLVGRWNNIQTIGDNLPNIMYVIDHNKYESKVNRLIGNTYLQVNFTPWLNYKAQLSIDQSQSDAYLYWNPTHGDGKGYKGYAYNSFNNWLRWNFQNILSFNKTFAQDHNVAVTLINEYEYTKGYNFAAYGQDLSNEFFNQNIISGTFGTMSIGGGMSDQGFISYAARGNYNYAGKYFIQGSVRYDGISSLPEANKYGLFPGASIGWTISKENFFSGLTNVVNDLKIRASYAEVGNVNIGSYPYLGLYGSAKYADNNGIAYAQAGNDQLQWEKSTKYDIGLDIQFLEGRIGATFDYYLNNIDDMILAAPYPASLGIPGNSINKNIGSMKNWGYELSVSAWILRGKDFEWLVDANITLPNNEVLSLVDDADIVGEYRIIRVNEPINALYGYKYWGVNEANGNPVFYKADGETLVQLNYPNSKVYTYNPSNPADMTTESSFTASDKMILGNTQPKYFGGLTSRMTYKNFDLNIMMRYNDGNFIMNRTRVDLMNLAFTNNGAEILGRWQSASEPGDGWTPRLYYGSSNFINKPETSNSRFVESGGYFKINNIQLGYNLPLSLISRAGLSNVRVYVQAQDLIMITKYTGIDPEMDEYQVGVDFNGSPRQRVITGGLSVTL
ncbi:TonB-dependent receptor [bacterium]|nr:TonB-dependent receptor [bacterium]